ncbi:MAG: glycosyltransferase [Bacteroidia bacterium]|jgi:glycosyltransferase involved in cell wall biosynthesis|nr:glycosyltransferase [Bacteroidia bacterium]
MPALVSIIVPCYNYGQFLTECLNSVLNQSYKQWECVVVDNGSTDNTAEVVGQFSKKDTRFSYLRTEQKGVSFARNTGIRHSRGHYVLALDADDKLESAFLEKTLKAFEKQPELKLVYSNARLFGASSGEWHLPEYNFKNLLIENSIFCTALYKRSDYDLTKGYNEEMREGFEDWDFWISLLKDGGEVYKVPEVLFNYRIRSQSRNHSIDKERQKKLRQQIFENHNEVYKRYFSISELVYENYLLGLELNQVKTSKEFKAGKTILGPMRYLQNWLKKG